MGTEVRAQTERVMENLRAILEAAGVTLISVVKTTVYLKDMNDFTTMMKCTRVILPLHRQPVGPVQARAYRKMRSWKST